MTIPQTAPSAPMPVYAITTPIPAAVEQHQTFGVSSSIGWYEVDASGEITTIPLGQSGPFTLLVNAEQILCSSLEAGIVTVWQSPTETGRGFGSTSVAAHIASSPVSVHGTSSADAGGSAPLDSPHFTGIPTAPTAAPSNNSTQLATTAYADAALGAGGVPIATTVTGPDLFGATPVVGVAAFYSPEDHDHGLPSPVDQGFVAVYAYNTTQSLTYATANVLPGINGGVPAGSIGQVGPYASDWSPLQTLAADDVLNASVVSELVSGIWDGVDLTGTMTVWDLTATNLIVATLSGATVSDATSPFNLTLTQAQLIGTDLSITGGTGITTAGGGVYNVQIQVIGSWD